jgi:hypothetical protein
MMQVREPPPPLPDTVPSGARELIDAVLVKDPEQRYATGGELAVAVAAVRRGDPLPMPGVAPRAPAAVDETGETVYPVHTPPSGSVPSAPAGSEPPESSPISSPVPSPRGTPAHAAVDTPGPRSSPGLRPAAYAPPTEPLRIPPARGPGRGLLLVLFLLLTLAAVVLGVILLRGGLGDTSRPPAASAAAVAPLAGSVAAAPLDTPRNRQR